jgi:hypothetical protein
MKAGTEALVQYLWEHPDIVETRRHEPRLFYRARRVAMDSEGIKRATGRQQIQSDFKGVISSAFHENKKVVFDKTPRYISDPRMAPLVMCLTPWVKMVALLRNPIDRIISQYNFENEKRVRQHRPMVDWDTWISRDLQLLNETGVIRDWNSVNFEEFSGSRQEKEAWERYLGTPGPQMIVGRGLYAIQLRHWFVEMDRFGKSRSDLLVLQSEKLKEDTQGEYNRLLRFLGLPLHQLGDARPKHATRDSGIPMPQQIQEQLEKFYAPYNRQLSDLLGADWDGVWES